MTIEYLKPFFSFYGGKWRAAPYYPDPLHGTIIEPFAGSAGYSLRYFERCISLYEIDPVIYSVWAYLITVSEREIRRLPIEFESVDELRCCQEAKWLIGFNLNKAVAHPVKRPSAWMRAAQGGARGQFWSEHRRDRIASQLSCIRHWRVHHCSYEFGRDEEATWFIDPPYSDKWGRAYAFNGIDYKSLAHWCRERQGQVIVCEREGADWLPFKRLGTFKSVAGSRGKTWIDEAMWYRKENRV